jgi:hypothetical protein
MNQTRFQLSEQTPIEAWLARLGLKAIEVGACPVADCPSCQADPVTETRAA